jgi:hypothetical protein
LSGWHLETLGDTDYFVIFDFEFLDHVPHGRTRAFDFLVVLWPRRSLEMTHLCSLKVTHIENTFADTALNLFLRCERKLICPRHLLDDRVDSRQPIAYE